MAKRIFTLISYFFHPINFSLIGAVLYFIFLPRYIFKAQEHLILLIIFLITYIFPLILLFLLKKFNMVKSYHMETIEERKFPTLLFIAITFIIGNWLYKSHIVDLLAIFYFGYGFALILSYIFLLLNIKLSLHAIGVSGLVGFILYFSFYYQVNLLFLIIGLFVLSGLILTARLKLKAHLFNELAYGYTFGILCQLVLFIVYYNI